MSITNDRLREIVSGSMIFGNECSAMAAELLAARESIEAWRSVAEVKECEHLAWEALGRPGGTHDTTCVQRLCAEVERLSNANTAITSLAFASDAPAVEKLSAEVERLKAENIELGKLAFSSASPEAAAKELFDLRAENATLRAQLASEEHRGDELRAALDERNAYRERTEAALDRFTSFVTKMVAVTEWRGMRWISEDGVMQKLNELGLARKAKESGHG